LEEEDVGETAGGMDEPFGEMAGGAVATTAEKGEALGVVGEYVCIELVQVQETEGIIGQKAQSGRSQTFPAMVRDEEDADGGSAVVYIQIEEIYEADGLRESRGRWWRRFDDEAELSGFVDVSAGFSEVFGEGVAGVGGDGGAECP
jgi:hypothetical protein